MTMIFVAAASAVAGGLYVGLVMRLATQAALDLATSMEVLWKAANERAEKAEATCVGVISRQNEHRHSMIAAREAAFRLAEDIARAKESEKRTRETSEGV